MEVPPILMDVVEEAFVHGHGLVEEGVVHDHVDVDPCGQVQVMEQGVHP